jgi:peptidoglycan/xylan/chitin deacetylase (PgdA/CDA1 family)
LKNSDKKQKIKNNFMLCLTHDVDRVSKTWQYVTHSLVEMRNGNFRGALHHILSVFQKNPYWNFDTIIKIENKHSVKSTFFFLNESVKVSITKPKTFELSLGRYDFNDSKVSEIIRWLDKNGWEIGLHGSYSSYRDLELLKKEKEQLENVVGHEIIGIRQHYLHLNKNTWNLQAMAGFKYDISYGFTRDVGFKNNRYFPFRPLKNNKEFIAMPLTIMDYCLMNKKDVEKEYMRIIDLAERKRAVLVVNWHQCIFNEKEFPGYSKTYERIIEECKKRGAKIVKAGDLYRYQ